MLYNAICNFLISTSCLRVHVNRKTFVTLLFASKLKPIATLSNLYFFLSALIPRVVLKDVFFPLFVHRDERDGREKHFFFRYGAGRLAEHPHLIGGGRRPLPGFFHFEAEDGAVGDLGLEIDPVQGPRHEAAARKFAGGGEPGAFVDPLQELAAEEVPVMVEMFRPDQRKSFHNHPADLKCGDSMGCRLVCQGMNSSAYKEEEVIRKPGKTGNQEKMKRKMKAKS